MDVMKSHSTATNMAIDPPEQQNAGKMKVPSGNLT